jgi:hypothetical protein
MTTERIDVLAVMDATGSVIRSRLSHYNGKAAKGCTHPETLAKQDRAAYLIGAHEEARATVADLIEAAAHAERKLAAYVGVCNGDKELTETALPNLRAVLARVGAP